MIRPEGKCFGFLVRTSRENGLGVTTGCCWCFRVRTQDKLVLAPCNRSLRKRKQVPTIFIFSLILSSLVVRLLAQSDLPGTERSSGDQITYVKELYDAGRWEAVIQAAEAQNDELPELELYRGLALAHLQR